MIAPPYAKNRTGQRAGRAERVLSQELERELSSHKGIFAEADESGVFVFVARLPALGRDINFIRLRRGLPKITNGPAQATPDLGQALCAENDQYQHQNNQKFLHLV